MGIKIKAGGYESAACDSVPFYWDGQKLHDTNSDKDYPSNSCVGDMSEALMKRYHLELESPELNKNFGLIELMSFQVVKVNVFLWPVDCSGRHSPWKDELEAPAT